MNDRPLTINTNALSLLLDPAGGVARVKRRDGAGGFSPLVFRASFRQEGGSSFDPVSSLVPGLVAEAENVKTPLGEFDGLTARLEAPGLPVAFTWQWAAMNEEDLLCRLALENRGDRNLTLGKLVPFAYRGEDPGLEMGAGYTAWRFYRLGYQSWSPAGSIAVMDHDVTPRFFLPLRVGANPGTPYSSRPGEKVSDWMAQVVEPSLGLSALLGAVGAARMKSRVELEVRYDRFRRLEMICAGEGALVRPGARFASEWCMLSLSSDPHEQQERYFEALGAAMGARRSRPRSGWCSWYFAFTRVNENTVNKNLAELDAIGPAAEVAQIDDGFEPWISEWTRWNDKFPSGPAALAGRVKDKGKVPGVWLAPFLVSRSSPLYHRHPEWVLRGKGGLPVAAMAHRDWPGRLMYALDPSHPAVRGWLESTAREMRGLGFDYLKLDFLYAGALPGVRHDPAFTGAMALRSGLEAIRKGAGDDAYLVGCGCPLGPAVGLLDAMRTSPDIDIHMERPGNDWLMGMPIGPSARSCLANNTARLAMHGRLWANDPDCVVLRDEKGGMKPRQMQTELTVYFLTAGALFLSEDIASLPAERLEWFRRMYPLLDRPARALDLFEKNAAETLIYKNEDSALIALINFQRLPGKIMLEPAALGLSPGRYHVVDYWDESYLGVCEKSLNLGLAPGFGVKYLRLTRADQGPRVIGSTLHMGMGEQGMAVSEDGGRLMLRAELPGARAGKVWAVATDGRVTESEVSFSDRFEGELAGRP